MTGYVIIAAVTLLIGLSFVVLMTNLGTDPSPMPVTEMFYRTYFFWLIVLLAAPVITMRLFALEKSSGTFETLMTTPVGDLQVVAAKFTAAIIFYIVMWLPMLACLFVVRHFTEPDPARWTRARLAECIWASSWSAACSCRWAVLPPPSDAQPDGGGDDQFCAGREPVCARFSGRGHSRGGAVADPGACRISACSNR